MPVDVDRLTTMAQLFDGQIVDHTWRAAVHGDCYITVIDSF